MDHAFQAQASQVIRHLGRGVGPPEERFDLGPQIAVAEAAGQMREAGECLQERHDAGIAESEG